MGNKSAKFTVKNEKNPEENGNAEAKTDNEVVAANGDHPKTEITETPEETTQQNKKKNPLAWLKKVSIRKEKKPKTVKDTNGVNHENGDVKEDKTEEAPAENGNIEDPKAEESEPKVESNEEATEVPEEQIKVDEATPEVQINGHCEVVENTSVPVEVQ